MVRDGLSSVSSQLKMAIMKKLRFVFLSIKLYKLRLTKNTSNAGTSTHKTRRYRSFNVGRRGLCGFFDEEEDDDDDDDNDESLGMTRRLHRTRSSIYGYDHHIDHGDDCDYDYDVDRRAEIFIQNFRSRLVMEREVSLKLRYCEKE